MSPSTLPTAGQSNGSLEHEDVSLRTDGIKSKTKLQAGSPSAIVTANPGQALGVHLSKLFSDNVVLKLWKTAVEHLAREDPPQSFPETCPQTGPHAGQYQYRDAEFWTCGFFPGSLYCLLERSVRYPQAFLIEGSDAGVKERLRTELRAVCRQWSAPLHDMAHRKDTHDIGFIVEPALRRDYELTGDVRSFASLVTAAESLASRYSEATKAIRSWDRFVNNGNNFVDKESEFLVIIDSMCNLDLLYYAGHHAASPRLIDIATTHAHTIRSTHLRAEPTPAGAKHPLYSTCHVANVCPRTGRVLGRLTAQGYADASTWSRGQAWAVLGFAQTYAWTKDETFLRTACGLADYFLRRLQDAPACVEQVRDGVRVGRHVPLWDFDAPADEKEPLRDTSAGVIAANGMLLIAHAAAAAGDFDGFQRYYKAATTIVEETVALCYARDELELVGQERGKGDVSVVARQASGSVESPFDCILKCATANFNGNWTDRYADHGLVYADYYLLEFGNRLLQFGYA